MTIVQSKFQRTAAFAKPEENFRGGYTIGGVEISPNLMKDVRYSETQ